MTINENYFIHTYNFVSYDAKKPPERKSFAIENGITGFLDCSLLVKTPLSIPDSEASIADYGKEGHTAYPFFKISGNPIIPGSEIRGMIRNMYETITNSCFSTINSNVISSRNIAPNNAVKYPGILKFNNAENRWVLLNAVRKTAYTRTKKKELLASLNGKKYLEREWDLSVQLSTNMQKLKKLIDNAINHVKPNGTYDDLLDLLEQNSNPREKIVEIKLDNNGNYGFIFKSKIKNDTLQDALNSVNAEKKWGSQYSPSELKKFFGMTGKQKDDFYQKYYQEPIINYSVFIPQNEEIISATELQMAVEKYNDILDFSETYAEGNQKTIERIRKVRTEEKKDIPVFFRKDNGEVIITPSHFSREIYNNTVEKILSEHKKCESKDMLCPGCRLFGIIGNSGHSVASRVRFSDASVIGNYDLDDKFTTLKVLASPKTTGWEFYADKSFDTPNVKLNGRKFYFHNPLAVSDKTVYTHDKKEKFNNSVQLMKNGKFSFKVFFDNITEKELEQLILSITLGDNSSNSQLMHKLGHGKPLGLGSVKIIVNDVFCRQIDTYSINRRNDYIENIKPLNNFDNKLAASEKTISELLNICQFDFCKGYMVSYPIIERTPGAYIKDNDVASHKYFAWMRNKLAFGKSEKQYEYNKLMPVGETAEAMKLPILVTSDGKRYQKKDGTNSLQRYGKPNAERTTAYTGYKLTCSVCGKEEVVDKGTFKQWNGTGKYKCKGCRTASKNG